MKKNNFLSKMAENRILIPIVVALYPSDGVNLPQMLVICISACCAGGVCGDHCSPISDTTILSSVGAGVDHLIHVSTQMTYSLTVAGCSLIGYIIIGITGGSLLVSLGVSALLLVAFLVVMHHRDQKRA